MDVFWELCKVLLILWTRSTSVHSKVVTRDNEWNDCCPPQFCPDLQSLVGRNYNNQTRYAKICQLGRTGNRAYYATFFDKENRIPVFSMFQIQHDRKGVKRRRTDWRHEGDLVNLPNVRNTGFIYSAKEICSITEATSVEAEIALYQAYDSDYARNRVYNRGHLNPAATYTTHDGKESTFTYTNAAPQYIDFNSGTWNNIERALRNYTKGRCRRANHVVVGVIPSNPANRLNNRVNIPSYFWSYTRMNNQIVFFLAPNWPDHRIQRGMQVTQFFLNNDANLNNVLSNFRSSQSVNEFRRRMRQFAARVPQLDVFAKGVSCNIPSGNLWKCSGINQEQG